MRKNTTKAKLQAGQRVVGAIIPLYSPAVVELFGVLGYDFVFIDCEHGPMDLTEVENMVRAAEAFNITPLARVPNHQPDTILRFLDRGVQGVMVPHINTKKQAEEVARAARYAPLGDRGFYGGARPHDYGVGHTLKERLEWANREVMVIALIEDIAALKELDGILSVPGVDMVMIGPGDLGQTMGFPPQEKVDAVMEEIIKRGHAAGKWIAVGGEVSPANTPRARRFLELGASVINVSPLGLLREGAEGYLKWARGL